VFEDISHRGTLKLLWENQGKKRMERECGSSVEMRKAPAHNRIVPMQIRSCLCQANTPRTHNSDTQNFRCKLQFCLDFDLGSGLLDESGGPRSLQLQRSGYDGHARLASAAQTYLWCRNGPGPIR